MKKKRLSLKLGIFFLLLFTTVPVYANEDSIFDINSSNVYQIKLPYAEVAKKFKNENIEKGNSFKLGLTKEKMDTSFLNLNIKLNKKDKFAETIVKGVINIDGSTFVAEYNVFSHCL